jgi:hypothetical protein
LSEVTKKAENLPPSDGFLKVSKGGLPKISKEQRSNLIRRGNEFFNKGQLSEAKRIFLTVGYSDGLSRLGDVHQKRNETLEALRMYWLAPDRHKAEQLVEKSAHIVRNWLQEDKADG